MKTHFSSTSSTKAHFWNNVSFLVLFLIGLIALFAIQPETVFSQTRFISPTNNSTGASTEPTIVLRTASKIDTSSIQWTYEDDTNYSPTFYIIPKHIFDTLPSSQWHDFNKTGVITAVDDSTLEFEPYTLDFATEYVIILNQLTLIEHDTEFVNITLADSIKSKFTITLAGHQLMYLSLYHLDNLMRCNDTIKIKLNRSITSISTGAGPLISCNSITFDSCIYDGDTTFSSDTLFRLSSISTSSWIDVADSSILYLKSSSFTPGNEYIFSLDLSRLTGDSTQDISERFTIRDKYKLDIAMNSPNPLDTLPEVSTLEFPSGSYYIDYQDTVKLRAPKLVGNYIFSHWQSVGYPSVNNSTIDSIKIMATCGTMIDVSVNAVYQLRSNDSISIQSAYPTGSVGIVIAYDEDFDSVTYSTGYAAKKATVWRFRARPIDSSYQFSHWTSSNSKYNNSTSHVVSVSFDNLISLRPNFTLKNPLAPGDKQLIGQIQYKNTGGLPQNTIAYFLLPNTGTSTASYVDNPNPANHSFTMKIGVDNFGIHYYIEPNGNQVWADPINKKVVDLYAPQTYTVGPYPSNDPPNFVFLHVDKLDVKLQVEIAMEDGSEPEGDLIMEGSVKDNIWVELISTEQYGHETPVREGWASSPSNKQRHFWELTYYAGVGVKLKPGVKDGFEFVGWSQDLGYNFGVGDNLDFSINPRNSIYKVKAIFKKVFKLEKIWVDQYDNEDDNSISNKSYTPDNWTNIQKEIGFDGNSGTNVRLMFDFNKALDPSTISNIRILRTTPYEYGVGNNVVTIFYPKAGMNATLSNNNKRLEWNITNYGQAFIVDANGHVRQQTGVTKLDKMEEFRIYVRNAVKCSTGENLSNPGDFLASTIYPDVEWKLKRIEVEGVIDPVWTPAAELYSLIAATVTHRNSSATTITTGSPVKIPSGTGSSDYYEVDEDESRDYDNVLITTQRIKSDAQINVGIANYDKDGDVNFGKIADILNAVNTAVQTELKNANDLTASTALTHVNNILQAAVSDKTKGVSGNDDDGLGTFKWYANRENRWGSIKSYQPQLEYSDGGDGRTKTKISVVVK